MVTGRSWPIPDLAGWGGTRTVRPRLMFGLRMVDGYSRFLVVILLKWPSSATGTFGPVATLKANDNKSVY